MLKSLTMRNYKCFKDETNMDIAPLTILCGVNSSGKSSIINSLLLQKQSYEDNFVSNSMKLNGEYVKCGRFSDILFGKIDTNKTVNLSSAYELNKPVKYSSYNYTMRQSKFDITAFKNISKIYPKMSVKKIKISSSIALKKHKGKSVSDNILEAHTICLEIIDIQNKSIKSSIKLKNLQNSQYQIILRNIPQGESGDIVEYVELHDATCYFENFNLINAFSSNIKPEGTQISGLLANVYLVFKMNAIQFKNMHYLTPLRVYPQRNYILDNENDDVGVGGEFTPYIMHEYKDTNIDGFFPPRDDKITVHGNRINFSTCVQKWMNYLQFGEYSLPEGLETIQLNISNYNISNVGFGISQVLPIIVSGLIKKENEILLLEQPEIHLHPIAQMCMADYLITMALNKREIIAETHSDHIINRVVRRMMENETVYKNTKIYFVDQDNKGISYIEEIKVDRIRGVLTNNEKFFAQFASETEKIMRAGFNNKHKEG